MVNNKKKYLSFRKNVLLRALPCNKFTLNLSFCGLLCCCNGRAWESVQKAYRLLSYHFAERTHYTKHYSKLHWHRYDNVPVHLIKDVIQIIRFNLMFYFSFLAYSLNKLVAIQSSVWI